MASIPEVTVQAVEVRAEVRQIKSMADHTYNLILNLPEDCLPQVQELMGWLGDEIGVILANVPQNRETTEDGRKRRRR